MKEDIVTKVRERLFENADPKYRDFQAKLVPNIPPESVIGVRTPVLRKIAKDMVKNGEGKDFLEMLPHRYFEENQLHGFIISLEKDYEKCMEAEDKFLTYVDNWATCDQQSPAVFKKNRDKVSGKIKLWIRSDETYRVRFAIKMMMDLFLGEYFDREYADMVADTVSDEYYVNMMRAWYFATALATNFDETVSYIENHRLDDWTHNKAIQKARESFRVKAEHKEYLKTLKK